MDLYLGWFEGRKVINGLYMLAIVIGGFAMTISPEGCLWYMIPCAVEAVTLWMKGNIFADDYFDEIRFQCNLLAFFPFAVVCMGVYLL